MKRILRIGITTLVILFLVGVVSYSGVADAIYVPALYQSRFATDGVTTVELPPEISKGLDAELNLLETQRDLKTRVMMAVHINEAYAGKDRLRSEVDDILSNPEAQEWINNHNDDFKAAKETGKARNARWLFSLAIIFYADEQETKIWNNMISQAVTEYNFYKPPGYSLGKQYILIPEGMTILDVILLVVSAATIVEIIIYLTYRKKG